MADLPFATHKKDQPVKIRMGDGTAGIEAKTVVAAFDKIVQKFGSKPALHQKVIKAGESAADTPWTTWTFQEYRNNVDSFAKSLLSIGFEKFDMVNILGFNAPEWHFANFGAIMAGGIAAGIYSTNGPDGCKYISEHSEAKVVVVEGVKQLEKYYSMASDLSHLKAIVMYGPDELPADVSQKLSVPVYTFADFLKLGESVLDSALTDIGEAQNPGDVTTLIYTSGTTGPPKAVMITHDNITWTANAQLKTMGRPLDNDDHMISYLPLSHIAAQMLDMHCPMQRGVQIWFAQPDALRGSLGATLKDVRPTIFFGVPRVWEKIYDKMQIVGKSTTGFKKTMSTWAKGQAAEYWENHQFEGNQSKPLLYPIAQLLLGKVRVALGLDRCMACYVSAAPIEVKILEYFASIDIPILELFGQSECSGPHCTNSPSGWKIGSIGRPLEGTISKLDPNNGELIYSGRHVFAGYMSMEDKTKETVDSDGFLHSGDVVSIDDCLQNGVPNTGFMHITGRIKEIIITAGGENIPPVLIEDQMKAAMPALSNAMAIGDKRKFLTILFCLQVEINEETGMPTEKLTGEALETSKKIGSSATTTIEAQTCDKWKKYFDDGMKVANGNAASRAQNVGKWALLDGDFTEPGGELTPTLKLKRSVAADKYSEEIEALYA
uniref:AMP-dependent synthetase/ligase domain-containing protein n=1 Tax=Chaetoceros debilis TaxID=122233 RepID=A0A7S3QC85_9STRA